MEDPSKCTVLVTDKIRRTIKFLCALANAVPIVSINWLHESKRAGHFLDWENYMLKDPAMEAKYGFRLRKSLDKARGKKLLDGYVVLLTPNIVSPPISELRSEFFFLYFFFSHCILYYTENTNKSNYLIFVRFFCSYDRIVRWQSFVTAVFEIVGKNDNYKSSR